MICEGVELLYITFSRPSCSRPHTRFATLFDAALHKSALVKRLVLSNLQTTGEA